MFFARRRILAAVALCSLGLTSPATAQSQPLRLATQVLPPYQMIEGDRMTGIAVERVQCALNALGMPYEFHMTSWASAQLGTETGRFDGFFVGSANAARAEFSVPSTPVVSEELAWHLPRSSEIDPNNAADALRARYSAKFATSKWRYLHKNGYNVVMRPRDAQSLLNMLLIGDIDAALEYELIFSHYMRLRGLADDHFRKIKFRRQDMSVHFAKRYTSANPLFLDRFNARMQACIASAQ